MRSLYEILISGPVNSDEGRKAREAGWRYLVAKTSVGCKVCGLASGIWLKDGTCFRCQPERAL